MQKLPTFSLFTSFYAELAFASFIAVNDSQHARKLYSDLRNSDKPSEKDRATHQPEIRKRICQDVTIYGLSSITTDLDPVVNSMEIYQELADCAEYSDLYNQIFPLNRNTMHRSHEYANEYVLEYIFGIEDVVVDPLEYVFICLMRDRTTENIIPFFVSKEYDVGPEGQFYKPGRFIFDSPAYYTHTSRFSYDSLMLAEEPAVAYLRGDFNVELYFLRMRKYIESAEDNSVDPLCKHVSADNDDPNNQHYRFCVAISTSLYFWSELRYPSQAAAACKMREVLFRTDAARKLAAGKRYYERVSVCLGESMSYDDDPDEEQEQHYIYISRAYKSNHVLVYEPADPWDEKLYLVNLSYNISVVDELNSFDLVED